MASWSSRHPVHVEFMTWAVTRGCRLFKRVGLTNDLKLVASAPIPAFDFGCVVQPNLVSSLLTLGRDPTWPHELRVSPANYATPVPWWPDVNRGMLMHLFQVALQAVHGTPTGEAAHVRMLIDAVGDDEATLTRMALEAQRTPEYRAAADSLCAQHGIDTTSYDETFARAYCATRRTGIALWSRAGRGHQLFAASSYASGPPGDVLGLVPMLGFASHSSRPNCAIGMLDPEMCGWIATERGVQVPEGSFALQALHGIGPGDALTVDRNAAFGFDDAEFEAWFGRPWDDDAPRAARQPSDDGTRPSTTADPDDIFF